MAETLTLPPALAPPGPAVGSYLTTTGVGHPHPGRQIPEKPLQWRYMKELPPGLRAGAKCRPLTVGDAYNTTTGYTYRTRERNMTTPTAWPEHKKAPGHWKVYYTKHTIDKCAAKAWCPSLTMANQSSEMRRQFQGKSDQIITRLPDSANEQPLPHTLRDHLNDRLTKGLPAATVNQAAEGRGLIASEGGILNRNEPYLTTNHCCHRYYTDKERTGYPSNDVATYWQCENYPKAWGFGMQYNPLDMEEGAGPKEGEDRQTTAVPMRDRTVFATATRLPPVLPSSAKPVSNGVHSLYSDMYKCLPASKTRKLFYCPVPPPSPVAKDTTQMDAVTHMYKSINTTYGNPPTRP